jgi:hypothetical protein
MLQSIAALTPTEAETARAARRRFSDESLSASDLAEEIDHWNRQRALWQGDLAARDFRDSDEAALRSGVTYAELRLAELTRQAERQLRGQAVHGYPPLRPRDDLSARFHAARYVDLVDLAQTVTGQTAIRAGTRHRLHCPFHDDDTPSLVVYPPGKGWHCFGCRRGGDAVAFVSEQFHIGAVEALAMVEEIADTAPAAWGKRHDHGV